MSLANLLGWPVFLVGLLVPIVGWLLFGMYAPFEKEEDRQDWLWSGLTVGILLLIMYAFYNVGRTR